MTPGIEALTTALAVSTSVIASEHEFSAMMSSPWSVDKFTHTPEDEAKVWELFWWSAIASLIFAIVISVILKNYWGIIASIAVIVVMWYLYKQAVTHEL